MVPPIRVHLTGGEESGWALDADMATTRTALVALKRQVELTSLEDADVVHSVWEEPILRLDPRRLDRKRIVCHLCNELMRTYEMPLITRAAERVGLWVPISREAEANLTALGLRCAYIPYTVDTTAFTERVPGGNSRRLAELLRSHDAYISAARNDPSSNALLEALSCGLPALYLDSGGSGELVGWGGLPFTDSSDILQQLDRLAASIDTLRSCIWVPTIDEIACQYIELARLLVADLP